MTSISCTQCGSCSISALPYSQQLEWKEHHLGKLFEKISTSYRLLPSVPSSPWHFRNKAKMLVFGTSKHPELGIVRAPSSKSNNPNYLKDSNYLKDNDYLKDNNCLGPLDNSSPVVAKNKNTWNKIEITNCPLHIPKINEILEFLKIIIRDYNLPPYELQKRTGELKALIVWNGNEISSGHPGEAFVRFIIRSPKIIPLIRAAVPSILQKFPQIKVISANIQPIHQAILEGEEEIFLTEEHWIHTQLANHQLYLSPPAFFQTNSEVASQLYLAASTMVKNISSVSSAIWPSPTMWDLYSGVGAFSFFCAPWVDRIVGVESSPWSHRSAHKNNLAINFNLQAQAKIDFLNHSILDFLHDFRSYPSPNIILVNPPRRGLDQELIDFILQSSASSTALPYIIYSSCNALTLCRDIEKLTNGNSKYELQSLQIFDMFPHTTHYETLALLRDCRLQ